MYENYDRERFNLLRMAAAQSATRSRSSQRRKNQEHGDEAQGPAPQAREGRTGNPGLQRVHHNELDRRRNYDRNNSNPNVALSHEVPDPFQLQELEWRRKFNKRYGSPERLPTRRPREPSPIDEDDESEQDDGCGLVCFHKSIRKSRQPPNFKPPQIEK